MSDMNIKGRGRGKFKPAPDLSQEQVTRVLKEKIAAEMELIHEGGYVQKTNANKYYKNGKYNVVSLFAGCGGLDLGFELAGLEAVIGQNKAMDCYKDKNKYFKRREESIFNTIYVNDNFTEALESYEANFPKDVVIDDSDIKKVSSFPSAELVLGGFPCPGFSEAGPRLIDDDRNFLYIHFIRCLMQVKPKFFVAENVKGMMTLGKGEVLKQIFEDFKAAGYEVKYNLLNACDYGVPQLRERIFLVGVRNDINYNYIFPTQTHGTGNSLLEKCPTLRDTIWDLKDDPGAYFTGSYSTIYLSRNRKKEWDDLSFTIQASGRQAPLHPDGSAMVKLGKDKWELPNGENSHRRLSVREIARIQTFPDWFEFSMGNNHKLSNNGKLDKAYKQIGNAVPVLLAKAVAKPIASYAVRDVKFSSTD